jgi:hypothetical protein
MGMPALLRALMKVSRTLAAYDRLNILSHQEVNVSRKEPEKVVTYFSFSVKG